MNKTTLFLALFVALSYSLSSEEIISLVNNSGSTWVAGHNEYFDGMSFEDKQYLMGSRSFDDSFFDIEEKQEEINEDQTDGIIPENFDSREKWPKCESIREIRDQSNCGSCWAFAVAEAISDRLCIYSDQTKQTRISTEDLLSCCPTCGDGCRGGYEYEAWKYWKNTGIVSGNLYEQDQYCKPYSFPPCAHHVTSPQYQSCGDLPQFQTPECKKECNPQYKGIAYQKDKNKGEFIYRMRPDVGATIFDIYKNGPLSASMIVYEDFEHYKSGVYQHKYGKKLGAHAVKLMGWGEENGTPYWLVANSWNESWGDKGFFKILRGANECRIESRITGGYPWNPHPRDEIIA